MHNLLKTINYLTEFFNSNYSDYFERMKDSDNAHYPPAFDGEDTVIQGIRNIVSNIEDNYNDLSIPTGFASPNLLRSSLVGFRDMAEMQLKETLKINKDLGEPWLDVISHSVKINSEVKEAIDFALTLAEKELKNGDEKLNSTTSVDVKDLSIGDIWMSAKRLKLSSTIWIVGIIITLLVGAYSAGIANNYFKLKTPVFTQHFTDGFVDREYLSLLIPEILEEKPDGIETDAEAMASLLWQIKSQDGYAEFLSGKKFMSVQIMYSNNNFNFKWNRGNSVVPKILNRLSLSTDESIVMQINAELNLIGVAFLPENNQIVRSLDGGLALVGSE